MAREKANRNLSARPIIARIQVYRAEIERHPPVVGLNSTAIEEGRAAIKGKEPLARDVARLNTTIRSLTEQRDALTVDSALLTHADSIKAQYRELGAVQQAA